MTIHLPRELEGLIRAEVARGRFASIDEAMIEAARLLLRELRPAQPSEPALVEVLSDPLLGSIGAMKENAELLDEIVADVYRHRGEETWRESDL